MFSLLVYVKLQSQLLALVLAAFFADAERSLAVLFFAAALVCFDNAFEETVLVGSFFNALILALDLVFETFLM